MIKNKRTENNYYIMRTLSLIITFLLLTGWIAIARYGYICVILQECEVQDHVPMERPNEAPRAKTLMIRYNDTVILKDYEEFSFSDGAVLPEAHPDNDRLLNDLSTYLINNPQRQVKIYGHYRTSEADLKSGLFENIGLARANAIRQELISRGIKEDRMALDYEETSGEILGRPISFELSGEDKDNETYKRVLFTFKDMTFSNANFAIDSEEFRPSAQFLVYADSLKTFLSENRNQSIRIIGHTDDDGNPLYNESLGRKRANSAKAFLKKMDIKNKILISSKGESQPVAPNTTEANKQKNRRVNFLLKK